MRTLTQTQSHPREPASGLAHSKKEALAAEHRRHSIPHLQLAIGNQAVQRMLATRAEGWPAGPTAAASAQLGHDFGKIPIYPLAARPIQTKLTISKPGDEYEQEADRICAQVMATPVSPAVSDAPPPIQRFSKQSNGQTAAPASVSQALANPGRPLDPALRQDMEQLFGHDFSSVRVHSGGAAERSARDVNANAYTVGHDMVFAEGRFAPGTHEGRRLIAHELTHVIQKGPGAGVVRRQPASPTEVPMEAHIRDELERELPADAEQQILGRKRELVRMFSRFNEWDAMALHGRLIARALGDSLASLFHQRLATPTRDLLLGILLHRSRRGDEPALEFTDSADRFLESLEVIVPSHRILLDAVQHPEETVTLQLWNSAPFPPAMDFSATLIVEREGTTAQVDQQPSPVAKQIVPWTQPIKVGFMFSVTSQKAGLHRVTLKVLDSKQQVVRIIRQTFEVETTIPQDLASLKDNPQYADSVVTAFYDPDRHDPDRPRRQHGLSTWIPVQYADGTIIDLNFSDFSPSGSATPFRWDNGKIFPEDITPVTAPNLTAVKHAVDLWIDDYNVLFIIQAFTAVVYPTITGVPMRVGPAPEATIPTARQRPRASVPVRPGAPSPGAPPQPAVVAPAVPVEAAVPPTGGVGGGGPSAPTPSAPIGGAMRVNVTQGARILDTDAFIALDRARQPGVTPSLSRGEQAIVAATQGRPIVATPTTVGQFNAAGVRGTVPVARLIPHTPAIRRAILQDLERAGVGGAGSGGPADREIVAEALLAQSDPGVVPVFQPAERAIINGLARLAKIDPARLPKGYNVAEYLRYERGVGVFAVTVRGRVLIVRPIQPIGPRR